MALVAVLLVAAVGLAPARPVRADELADRIVADALDDDLALPEGPGLEPSPAAWADLARRIAATNQRWAFVVTGSEPPNAKALASEVLAGLRSVGGSQSTVVVLTPSTIGAESRTYSGGLDDALRAALPHLEADPVAGLAEVFEALSGTKLAKAAVASSVAQPGHAASGRGVPSAAAIAVIGAAVVAAALAVYVSVGRR